MSGVQYVVERLPGGGYAVSVDERPIRRHPTRAAAEADALARMREDRAQGRASEVRL